jgi:hypothetical protein
MLTLSTMTRLICLTRTDAHGGEPYFGAKFDREEMFVMHDFTPWDFKE